MGDKLLRFKGITFASGGTFKLCFCDSSLLGGSSACKSEADYSVEVGTIHASGVSCLIALLQAVREPPESDAAAGRAHYGRDVQDDHGGDGWRRSGHVHALLDDERGGGQG